MNQKKDKTLKNWFQNNAYFTDLFNAYLFDGQPVLKAEACQSLDSEMNDVYMDVERHVDVIRKYNDGNIYSAFIIENQSVIDDSMVARAAAYEFLAYDKMIKKKRKNKRFIRGTKIPMVNILVFYVGEKPWDGPLCLHEMVDVNEKMKPYFNDYRMNLIEINGDKIYNFSEKGMHQMFYICRAIYNQSIHEEKVKKGFGLVNEEILKVVKVLTDVQWLNLEDLQEKGEVDMCEAERLYIEKTKKVSRDEGIKQGQKELVLKLIHNGKTIEEVATLFGETPSAIQTIIK